MSVADEKILTSLCSPAKPFANRDVRARRPRRELRLDQPERIGGGSVGRGNPDATGYDEHEFVSQG